MTRSLKSRWIGAAFASAFALAGLNASADKVVSAYLSSTGTCTTGCLGGQYVARAEGTDNAGTTIRCLTMNGAGSALGNTSYTPCTGTAPTKLRALVGLIDNAGGTYAYSDSGQGPGVVNWSNGATTNVTWTTPCSTCVVRCDAFARN